MIEILNEILKICTSFINFFFTLKIELTENFEVSIGELTVAFAFIVIVIYLVFKALGILERDDY